VITINNKTQKLSRFDALSEQFQKQQKANAQKPKEEKKSIYSSVKKHKYIFLGPVLVLICLLVFFWGKGISSDLSNSGDLRTIPAGLPKAEVERWKNKKVDKDMAFIKLNTALTMKEGEKAANLSLINPPYSAYDFRVKIVLDNDSEDILYISDLVKPGTFNKTVKFQKSLSLGHYNAIVYYTFYGETGDDVIKEHEVEISIAVSE